MITVVSLLIIPFVIFPNAQAFDYWTNCSTYQTSTNNQYQTNIQGLLHTFTYQALTSGFQNSSSGQPPNRVYALYLCRADIDGPRCSECVYLARVRIFQDCGLQPWALLWSDLCVLRFSNTPIFQNMSVSPRNVLPGSLNLNANQTQVLNETMTGLVNRVSGSPGRFGTEERNRTGSELYALGQCTPDLNPGECGECVRTAINNLPFTVGGRVFQPSCYVRLELTKFYGDSVNLTFLLSPTNNSSSVQGSQSSAIERSSICGSSSMVGIIFSLMMLI